jgi:hypothetical protein
MVYHVRAHFPKDDEFMGDDTVLEAIGKGYYQSHNASGRPIDTHNHHPSSSCSKNEE